VSAWVHWLVSTPQLAIRCDVQGAACHSAYAPQGVNAIEYAAQLIGELGRIGSRLRAPELHDSRFDPPFSTVQTGLISGGSMDQGHKSDEFISVEQLDACDAMLERIARSLQG
jgi:acetylornithine deacetylase/succinyl-diaminopimelate desuccinylase-like protein